MRKEKKAKTSTKRKKLTRGGQKQSKKNNFNRPTVLMESQDRCKF